MSCQTPLPMKFVIPTSPVEVVSKSNDMNILEKYIVKSPKEHVSSSIPYIDPIIVDLQQLLESEEELQKFESLVNSWGTIQLFNHGIESSKLDQVLQITKEFFHLPFEEKQKYARSNSEEWAYDGMEGWGNDRMGEGRAFNWSDRLMLSIYPHELRKNRVWPDESLPKFREIIDEYLDGVIKVRDILFKAVTKMLNLPENNLISKYVNEGVIVSRFNYYPPAPYPDRMFGAKPHTDSNLFTILLPDNEVEGLHIEKDDQWYKVPVVPGALIINTSDMLEIMSNGRLKSPCHRVVTNADKERISIVFAVGPPPNSEIGPLKELINDKTPKLYPSLKNCSQVTADYYARDKIFIKEVRKLGPSIILNECAQSKNDTKCGC